ncbi:MAG: hypothetical protein HeimC3_51040 [Candidatus Heimdallarchaeota archaeon LC_3]|nr:MAG: hypothetical protein HeimC3_51040 [Candidatus Heimdallarchaeota archaeon LC_3]
MVFSLKFVKRIIRWLKFHLFIKNKFKKRFGNPKLCNNLEHRYHDSNFEKETCLILEKYFHQKSIIVPSQHKLKTKFDFIIKGIAIIEPHGIWNGNGFYSYYKKRKILAEKFDLDLPVIIIPNYSDLTQFDTYLQKENNPVLAMKQFQLLMLNRYQDSNIVHSPIIATRISEKWKSFSLLNLSIIIIQFVYIFYLS